MCLAVILLPKAINRFTPKVIVKEIPIVKEVIKEVIKEVPVFKGEKVVEIVKEKIVYQPTPVDMFVIEKISDDEYTVALQNLTWGPSVGVRIENDRIRFQRNHQPISAFQHAPYRTGPKE